MDINLIKIILIKCLPLLAELVVANFNGRLKNRKRSITYGISSTPNKLMAFPKRPARATLPKVNKKLRALQEILLIYKK